MFIVSSLATIAVMCKFASNGAARSKTSKSDTALFIPSPQTLGLHKEYVYLFTRTCSKLYSRSNAAEAQAHARVFDVDDGLPSLPRLARMVGVRKEVANAPGYVAPERCGRFLLDLNECPFPPPRAVVEALCFAGRYANRYPGRELFDRLRQLVADYVGVGIDNVAVFGGGDEGLWAVFEAFIANGDGVVLTKPGFAMVRVYAEIRGAKTIPIPLQEEGFRWTIDFNGLVEVAKKAKLVVIENPHNPTGSLLLTPGQVRELLVEAENTVVLVDEAYYEFAGVTVASLVKDHSNLLVLRTLSKAFCLAGLRVGYLVAAEETLKQMASVLAPFTISRPSLVAAIEALENRGYVGHVVRFVVRERERLFQEINKIDGFKAYMSKTNFLLVKTPENVDIAKLALEQGIRIKRVKDLPGSYVRVSIGLRRANELLLEVLRGATAKP